MRVRSYASAFGVPTTLEASRLSTTRYRSLSHCSRRVFTLRAHAHLPLGRNRPLQIPATPEEPHSRANESRGHLGRRTWTFLYARFRRPPPVHCVCVWGAAPDRVQHGKTSRALHARQMAMQLMAADTSHQGQPRCATTLPRHR
jgi:hypothetical protein